MLTAVEIIFPLALLLVIGTVLLTQFSLNRKIKHIDEKLTDRQIALSEIDYAIQKVSGRLRAFSNEAYQSNKKNQPADINYRYATKLLQAGGNIKEVIETCQLSQGEAELLSVLNKNHY